MALRYTLSRFEVVGDSTEQVGASPGFRETKLSSVQLSSVQLRQLSSQGPAQIKLSSVESS